MPIRQSPRERLFRPWIILTALLWTSTAAAGTGFDVDLYGRLLESHTIRVTEVVGTRVDYRGLATSEDWKRLVGQVHAARPDSLARDEKLAFWINAYNILTIDLVTRNYPIEGINQIGSFFSPVWDLEVLTIEGRALSLGEIEHDILRKMNEPRIHAAIVCASISCPPLARTPYRARTIDADLSSAMRTWLGNPDKGVAIDRESRTVRLSKIFDWFEEDFESNGGVLETIAAYLSKDDAAWLRQHGRSARIRYLAYDWSLNDSK